mmetsp:Transcript_52305/g.138174  ORF Transcript_52305/g.138174 Transcript_52305/m.138174 type:complete len:272 (+) Transcript_52305:103-918(+)
MEAGPTWLSNGAGSRIIAQNSFHNGEAWPHLASGAALRGSYNKTKDMDDDWWLRNNDKLRASSTVADAGTFYYNEAPLMNKCFKAHAVGENHSMKVFRQLAKTGHSFSETNLQTLREDPELRKQMKMRYNEVMGRAPSASPGPPSSRSRGSPSPPEAKTSADAARTWSGDERGLLGRSGSAVAGDAASPDERGVAARKLPQKQPKWGSADATPKAELRAMATGRRIVCLPNSRLMLNEKVPDPVHSVAPPRRPRGGMIPAMCDYEGESIMY